MVRSAAAARALCTLVALACAAGCSPAAPPSGAPPSAPGSPGPVGAAVDQFRDEYASGSVVLQVTDTGGAPFTVVRAELDDPRFQDGTVWSGSADLTAGQTLSLPTALAAARCDRGASDAAPSLRVHLADGTDHTVAAADPHAVLPRLHGEQCFAQQAALAVRLRLEDTLGAGSTPSTAVLTLAADAPAEPTGSSAGPAGTPPQAILEAVEGTTLLGEDPGRPWPHGVILAPGTRVALAVRPARCDPHAVAEDKVGTLLPVELGVGGAMGVVKVAALPALRAALYRFVARACGWPAG
ncbi:hypothetical protein [Sinomonas atrocyanea]